jgi:hypothetical protein
VFRVSFLPTESLQYLRCKLDRFRPRCDLHATHRRAPHLFVDMPHPSLLLPEDCRKGQYFRVRPFGELLSSNRAIAAVFCPTVSPEDMLRPLFCETFFNAALDILLYFQITKFNGQTSQLIFNTHRSSVTSCLLVNLD